ncbi:MAG TPA: hypothetical protein VN950_08625 [Terriglobales bacterium]|nr:hypothetical protein [Terriglobales bacterium]
MKNPEFVLSTILAIIITGGIAYAPGEGTTKVKLAICYAGLVLLFLFGFLILAGIASGKIDISTLLAESGGGASMSRFQLLIFTFVIGLSFFLIVVSTGKFPDPIPAGVMTLLGISATTYGVSKGIQATGMPGKIPPPAGNGGAGGQRQ